MSTPVQTEPLPFEDRLRQLYLDVTEIFTNHGSHEHMGERVCPADGRCDPLNDRLASAMFAAFPVDEALTFFSAELLDVRFGGAPETLREAIVDVVTTLAYDRIFPHSTTPSEP